MTHHFVMTSSLHIKILKIEKFHDFSSDIDYNSKTDIFRKSDSGGHKVSVSRAAQTREARLLLLELD